jgi:succinate dehydrogenase / fumarate reductase flavoprotein subunit
MRTLRDEVRSRAADTPGIGLWEFRPAIELVLDEHGRVAGAILKDLDTQRLMLVRAKAVVVATGGSGRLHYQDFPTTNHYGATGDGLVLAYRVGARLSFIDTMQYHPTGAAFPEQILGQLVTEKVRGLGAQVCNVDGEQFVFPLETRDVEAAAFIRECLEKKRGVVTPTGQPAVWLDSPLIEMLKGPGTVARELPAMVRQYRRFGIDMIKEPILVYPTLHYQNGGVAIRPDGSTDVAGLFVAGDAAGGIHGRNRLMGNSLLDICVFGRRAGHAAAEWARTAAVGTPSLAHLIAWGRARRDAGLTDAAATPVILPDYTRNDQHGAALGTMDPRERRHRATLHTARRGALVAGACRATAKRRCASSKDSPPATSSREVCHASHPAQCRSPARGRRCWRYLGGAAARIPCSAGPGRHGVSGARVRHHRALRGLDP